MLFNSFEFLVFFPVVAFLYFSVRKTARWVLLLAASYIFYAAWEPAYLLLIMTSTGVDYWAGRRMGTVDTRRARRPYLLLSLLANLGLLFVFKYFNFFAASLEQVSSLFAPAWDLPALDVLLPVGISFYTFQTLAYSIDVYRGTKEPEHHLGMFALYVSFFPQLVAGPIERSQRLLPQFREEHAFDYDRVVEGLQLAAWGFFKKVVIADRLGVYVNQVYNAPDEYSGVPVIVATYFFAIQIYCDFSGYSDIAIGIAKVLGFDLMENFRRPYFSKSIGEFWRRWHISLSSWFRDYLYIPLGGNRVVRSRWFANLMIVFVVSGLWHGANWTFVIWGALHGFYLIASVVTQDRRDRLWDWVRRRVRMLPRVSRAGLLPTPSVDTVRRWLAVFTTFHLVLVAWVFFRANSLSDALVLLRHAFVFDGAPVVVGLTRGDFALALASIVVLFGAHLMARTESLQTQLNRQSASIRWLVYVGVTTTIVLFGWFDRTAFIYFQF